MIGHLIVYTYYRKTFVVEVNRWITRYNIFWNRLEMNAVLERMQKQYVSYEEIQLNTTKAMSRILSLFGVTPNKYTSYINSDSTVMKRTNDNLRSVLVNYDDIRHALSRHHECSCLLAQLVSTG